jgi:hypothetical protein
MFFVWFLAAMGTAALGGGFAICLALACKSRENAELEALWKLSPTKST